MKAYCFDTSGFSNPLETMPDDIHRSMWRRVMHLIEEDRIAVTTEIYEEMTHIGGTLGESIREHRAALILDLEDDNWDWETYVHVARDLQLRYGPFISEWQGGRKGTIGLNDLSIIALAKTLRLPVVSMEKPVLDASSSKRKIPNICDSESVEHLDFNGFLRREKISI